MRRRTALLSGLSGLLAGACSPAGLLNGLSRVTGDSDARLAGDGVTFDRANGLKLDVWVPRAAAATPTPVVVFFYGGGWVSGRRGEYGFAGRALAARGITCVVPDYRLVPSVRFPSFVEDSARAVRWVVDTIATYGGDPRRVGLSGHSAGSYNAAMLALDRHFLRDAGVDPRTVRSAALLSGPYDFYPFTEQRGRDALGAWPRPRETQPISFANAEAPPMLLMHGTADTVVRPANSIHLAAALDKAGADAELKLYPGRSHVDLIKALSPPFRGSAPALDDMVAFFQRTLA